MPLTELPLGHLLDLVNSGHKENDKLISSHLIYHLECMCFGFLWYLNCVSLLKA